MPEFSQKESLMLEELEELNNTIFDLSKVISGLTDKNNTLSQREVIRNKILDEIHLNHQNLKKENIILQQLLDELEIVQNSKNGEELKEAIEYIGKNRNHQVPGRTQMFKMNEQLSAVDKVIKAEIAPNYLTRRFGIRQQAMMLGFYENKEKELKSIVDTINIQTKLNRILSGFDDIEKFSRLYLPINNPIKGKSFMGWEYDWTDEEDMEALDAAPNNCIWTVIEGDEGIYVAAGKHQVNRLAYIITNYP